MILSFFHGILLDTPSYAASPEDAFLWNKCECGHSRRGSEVRHKEARKGNHPRVMLLLQKQHSGFPSTRN